MIQYLPLKPEQRERVYQFLRKGAPVSSLKTSVELHYAARSWNWDNGEKELLKIIQRPDCSLATALMIYWNGEPQEIFFDCANTEDAEEEFGSAETYHLLETIEKKILGNQYQYYNIGFDPQDSNGIDLTEGWDDPDAQHAIDKKLTQEVKGLMADPKIFF